MKNIVCLLFTLCTLCLTNCDNDPFDSDKIKTDVNFSKRGVLTVAKVAIRNVDAKKIDYCGIKWETRIPILPGSSLLNSDVIETEGGLIDYEFEVFPWDGIFVDDQVLIETCVLGVQPYIVVNGAKHFGPTRYYTVETPMDIQLSASTVEQDKDLIVTCRFSFPKRKEDIEECGVYWYSDQDNQREGQYVMGGKEDGYYDHVLKNVALFDSIYTRAYVKTWLGTYYTAPKVFSSNVGDMHVNINEIYDLTFEQASLSAINTSQNEAVFPVLKRGFCYIQEHDRENTLPPTINNNDIPVEPGIGKFTGTIKNLLPESAYRVRAYTVNERGITYSGERRIITSNPEAFTPYVTILSGSYNSATKELTMVASIDGRGYEITERGFYYNTTATPVRPTISDTKLIDKDTGNGVFTIVLENISSGRYNWAAYAVSRAGTGVSNSYKTIYIP